MKQYQKTVNVRGRAIKAIEDALAVIESDSTPAREGVILALVDALARRALVVDGAPIQEWAVGPLAEQIILALDVGGRRA